MSTNISTLYSKKAATKIASGLAAVSGYEPWPMRTIESMKESLADGVPILARLHSAADYPTSTEETDHKLDMESHAILLIGYDDAKEKRLERHFLGTLYVALSECIHANG